MAASTVGGDQVVVLQRFAGAVACLLLVVMASPVAASATPDSRFGTNYLQWNLCCNGQALSGTRSFIRVDTDVPDSNNCIYFANWVTSVDTANKQIAVGNARCGTNAKLDGTCSLNNNFVGFVEVYHSDGSASCTPHGVVTIGTTNLYAADDCCGNGNMYAYINSTQYEFSGGFSGNNFLIVGGEYTGAPTCTYGWSASAEFTSWERWTLTNNSWNLVQGANTTNGACWQVGSTTQDFTVHN
jgi:hypothetical protein